MIRKTILVTGLVGVFTLSPIHVAHAQFAVVDVGAIGKLTEEVLLLQQQLEEAQAQLRAITGRRGMESLLAGSGRNYLPSDWQQMLSVLQGAQSTYGQLAAEVRAISESNAVLTAAQMAGLSAAERHELQAARQSAAALQALSHQALAATSERFAALQELIDAIGQAEDQKAILDLQARVQAEQVMLTNEQSKLQLFYQAVQAEELARQQRAREKAIAGIGSLRNLPPMGLAK
jgi:type IV secretion system protein VirB5